jgi:SAM-dependent methyltransferase
VERSDTLPGGDRNAAWRESYLRVRKDAVGEVDRTNQRRLRSLGSADLDPRSTWLDLGAGDGNVSDTLLRMGIDVVVALEYQKELLDRCPPELARVVATADGLPIAAGSIDVVVVMDVLHHLTPGQLRPTLDEIHRVLRPGGHLLVCEPAATLVRSVLGHALMSPLSRLTEFSRDKRRMVELEADTLFPWLAAERRFVDTAGAAGFDLEVERRRPLHTLRRFRWRAA